MMSYPVPVRARVRTVYRRLFTTTFEHRPKYDGIDGTVLSRILGRRYKYLTVTAVHYLRRK